ncbi:hypothetical protein CEE44_00010 [Candidatus Woesearchaeota archaeon B3_Woes]|nr:MAG: hypothetical protein CEE44_00010 [Candidatus Woesearchaeota archaeon B3_Woes]
MTLNWKDNSKLAEALLSSIKKYSLGFTPGEIPSNPISPHESVNLLYYGNPAILCEDSEGRLMFYSQHGKSVFGYSADEAIGMSSVDLAPERFREGREQLFNEIIERDKPETIGTVRIHKSGKEINISAQVFPYEINGEKSIGAIVKKLTDKTL